jgi:ribonuclease HI
MRPLEIYIDGSCKGNPGPAGIGVVICRGQELVKNISRYIGNATNNIAEYTALLYGLQEALILKAVEVIVSTDSELLYRQLKKYYRIKSPNLIGLYQQAEHLLSAFGRVSLRHIPRRENKGADKLADQAVQQALKGKPRLIQEIVL